MKNKLFLLSIMVLGAAYTLTAQDIRFGAKAGLNISNLSGESGLSYNAKPGFHLGGVLEIPVSDAFMVQPEALISLQGSGGYFENDPKLWYLNVPVLGKFNIWDKLYIEAGPQVSLLLSDNLKDNRGGSQGNYFDSNSIDFGLAVGAGYRLDDNFYFQVRFNAGFVNAIKDQTSKNRVIQISVVYFL